MYDQSQTNTSKSIKINFFERHKFHVVLPAAGVLVEASAGEALVTTSGSQNPPSFLSTADLDPGEVW